jgi:hypothetical protein
VEEFDNYRRDRQVPVEEDSGGSILSANILERANFTSVWLTIEQIQLVANRVVFRCGLIVRKGL